MTGALTVSDWYSLMEDEEGDSGSAESGGLTTTSVGALVCVSGPGEPELLSFTTMQ